jgi:hypothetical protein
MKRHQVQVDCYAGSRADERPRRVRESNREHIVARLLGSSVEESLASKEQVRRYRVLTDEGLTLDLARASDGKWYLEGERAIEE